VFVETVLGNDHTQKSDRHTSPNVTHTLVSWDINTNATNRSSFNNTVWFTPFTELSSLFGNLHWMASSYCILVMAKHHLMRIQTCLDIFVTLDSHDTSRQIIATNCYKWWPFQALHLSLKSHSRSHFAQYINFPAGHW